MLSTAKKGKFICTGPFFPIASPFWKKGEGVVLVYVFLLLAISLSYTNHIQWRQILTRTPSTSQSFIGLEARRPTITQTELHARDALNANTRIPNQHPLHDPSKSQQTGVYPIPLGRRVCETKSKKGCSRHRSSFMHRVYSAWREILSVPISCDIAMLSLQYPISLDTF